MIDPEEKHDASFIHRKTGVEPKKDLGHLIFGRHLATADAPHQTIGKIVGLAFFASDALSSSAALLGGEQNWDVKPAQIYATLTRLEKADLASLQRALRRGQYHVFHFIGHGGFDNQAQDGVLLTEGDSGRGRPVSGYDLGTLLHDHRSLRLAVLNACEGARTSLTDPFAGTAPSLVQNGIPAVIAMQFEITDSAAITLAYEFYAAIADGYPVDAALAEARKAIFARGNDIEWGTPVLFTSTQDGQVFDIDKPTTRPTLPLTPV